MTPHIQVLSQFCLSQFHSDIPIFNMESSQTCSISLQHIPMHSTIAIQSLSPHDIPLPYIVEKPFTTNFTEHVAIIHRSTAYNYEILSAPVPNLTELVLSNTDIMSALQYGIELYSNYHFVVSPTMLALSQFIMHDSLYSDKFSASTINQAFAPVPSSYDPDSESSDSSDPSVNINNEQLKNEELFIASSQRLIVIKCPSDHCHITYFESFDQTQIRSFSFQLESIFNLIDIFSISLNLMPRFFYTLVSRQSHLSALLTDLLSIFQGYKVPSSAQTLTYIPGSKSLYESSSITCPSLSLQRIPMLVSHLTIKSLFNMETAPPRIFLMNYPTSWSILYLKRFTNAATQLPYELTYCRISYTVRVPPLQKQCTHQCPDHPRNSFFMAMNTMYTKLPNELQTRILSDSIDSLPPLLCYRQEPTDYPDISSAFFYPLAFNQCTIPGASYHTVALYGIFIIQLERSSNRIRSATNVLHSTIFPKVSPCIVHPYHLPREAATPVTSSAYSKNRTLVDTPRLHMESLLAHAQHRSHRCVTPFMSVTLPGLCPPFRRHCDQNSST
jgi:hypothetical protein